MSFNIDGGESAWTASSNVTSTADTTIYKQGKAAAKHVIAAGFTTGLASYYTLPKAFDVSHYDGIAFWAYCTVAQVAGDLEVLLDDTAACSSALENLDIPALVASTWKLCVVPMATPRATAMEGINAVGLNVVVDNGAETAYLDMITAVKSLTHDYLSSVPVGKVRRFVPNSGSVTAQFGLYAQVPSNATMIIEFEQ